MQFENREHYGISYNIHFSDYCTFDMLCLHKTRRNIFTKLHYILHLYIEPRTACSKYMESVDIYGLVFEFPCRGR